MGVDGIADLTKEQLTPILSYHIVSGNVLSDELNTSNASTLNGDIAVNVGSATTINESSHSPLGITVGNPQGGIPGITRFARDPVRGAPCQRMNRNTSKLRFKVIKF